MPKRTPWPLRGPSRATYRGPFAYGAVVLGVGLLLSWLVAATVAREHRVLQERGVYAHLQRVRDLLPILLQSYERGIRGVGGAVEIAAVTPALPAALATYTRALDAEHEFPGDRGFGFLRRQTEADDRAPLDIVSGRPVLDPRIRATARDAWRRGEASLSAPIPVPAEPAGSAAELETLWLILPVRPPDGGPAPVAGRPMGVSGWAYTVLGVNQVIARLRVDSDLFLIAIRDITDDPTAPPFFATGRFDARLRAGLSPASIVPLYGRSWAVAMQPTPAFLASLPRNQAGPIAVLGTLISTLAGAFTAAALSLRARREDMQLRTREQFRLALEAAPNAMFVMNPAGRITFVNRSLERLIGHPREELRGRAVEWLLPERLRASFANFRGRLLREARAGVVPQDGEIYVRTRDGREVPVELHVSPLDTTDGVVMLCSIVDVSGQRVAAETLRALNAQLAEQVSRRSGELRSVQRGLATILDALPSMIGYWDRHLVNGMSNRAYGRLLAAHAGAPDGKASHLLDPLLAGRSAQIEVALRGESVTYEHTITPDPGDTPRHLLVHLIPDLLDGAVTGFYLLAHDVTELTNSRLHLGAVIRENEALLSTLNQHALVSVADRTGRIIDVNAAFCQISGYSREELLGEDHRIVSSASHPRSFWHDMWRQLGQGRPWRAEVCNRAKNGSLYWVDSIITPFFAADGKILKYISIRFDITAHREAQRRLSESELFLQGVERVSGVGGFMIDLASGVQRWTRQSYRICEVEEGRPPTKELFDGFLAPDDRARFQAVVRQACDSGSGYDLDMPLRTDAGRSIWIRTVGEIERTDGKPVRIVGAIEDITTRRALEERLREATARAERASLAKSEFLANMSHEIRTPLNAVIGLGYLLEQTPLEEDQQRFVSKIQFAGRALLSVVNNVLDLSKIEAGEMSLEDEPFDVRELARDVGQMLASEATRKNIELIVQTAPTLPRRVCGDASRIRQVLTNLVNNAIKFTESGSVRVQVFGAEQSAHRVRLRCEVQDTGIGIEAQAIATLFEPFTQADASTTRRFGGTGLGLSIARQLIALMGGEIGVTSVVGSGSSFWFELPLRIAESLDGAADADDPGRMRILILDASGDSPGGLAAMVRALGWLATVVSSEAELVETLDAGSPDGWPDVLIFGALPAGIDAAGVGTRLTAAHVPAELPPMIVVSELPPASASAERLLETSQTLLLRPVSSSALFNAINSAVWKRDDGRERLLQSTNLEEMQTQWLAGVRVLVVDDSDINLEVARRILEKQGAIVACCADGNTAVEHVRSHHLDLDLVLMDIQMPLLDGNEATRYIRRELSLTKLPIIALTAGALVGEQQRSLEAGVNDFVSKPFDPLALIRKVRRLVEQARGEPIALMVREHGEGHSQGVGALLPSIDGSVVQQMFGDDLTLFKSLLLRLLRDYADLEDTPALQLDDEAARAALAMRAHKLKGSAGMLGASRVMRLASAAEHALQAHRGTETVDRLFRELARSLKALKEESERLLAMTQPVPPAGTGRKSGEVTNEDLEELCYLLDRQDLSAIDKFRGLADDLAETLPATDFGLLQAAIDNLDFHIGAELLRHAVLAPGGQRLGESGATPFAQPSMISAAASYRR